MKFLEPPVRVREVSFGPLLLPQQVDITRHVQTKEPLTKHRPPPHNDFVVIGVDDSLMSSIDRHSGRRKLGQSVTACGIHETIAITMLGSI